MSFGLSGIKIGLLFKMLRFLGGELFSFRPQLVINMLIIRLDSMDTHGPERYACTTPTKKKKKKHVYRSSLIPPIHFRHISQRSQQVLASSIRRMRRHQARKISGASYFFRNFDSDLQFHCKIINAKRRHRLVPNQDAT